MLSSDAPSEVPPDSAAAARCAVHPDVAAERPCRRCGSFMCTGCQRYVRVGAQPLCVACFALREAHVQAFAVPPKLPTVALVLGLLSLLPLPPVQLVSLVVAGVAVHRHAGWQPWTALGLTLVGGMGSVLVYVG